MTAASLLEFRQIQCIRDERILFHDLDFSIASGDIVHIQGPNGVGKTTLLRALTGLFDDYQGDILWRGHPVRRKSYDFNTQLLFIGHNAGIKTILSPRENLQFLTNLHADYSLKEIDQALEQVGLYGYEDMPGYQLSAGQKRRIALARLYLNKASIWVLDEPYTALDAQGIGRLERLFIEHAKQGGCVILTSHQPPSIEGIKSLPLQDYQTCTSTHNLVNPGVAESDHSRGSNA